MKLIWLFRYFMQCGIIVCRFMQILIECDSDILYHVSFE